MSKSCLGAQEVDLSSNLLTGTLPATMNYTQDLRVLDLSNNSLSGPLPALLAADHIVVRQLHCGHTPQSECIEWVK